MASRKTERKHSQYVDRHGRLVTRWTGLDKGEARQIARNTHGPGVMVKVSGKGERWSVTISEPVTA